MAGGLNTAWVAQAYTSRAPSWCSTLAALVMVPAVSIMSSTSTATLPRTSPIRFITSDTLCADLGGRDGTAHPAQLVPGSSGRCRAQGRPLHPCLPVQLHGLSRSARGAPDSDKPPLQRSNSTHPVADAPSWPAPHHNSMRPRPEQGAPSCQAAAALQLTQPI
jgi:hypothetical protein